ncbi:MAG: class I SAM-dependent methyltransferase [Bacteroidetes bacterium]|nr:MAG: class I SAM-dependent methyltransferase [Bacteroidota bacterium]
MNENQQIYESKKVVRNYRGLNKIYPAERVLLDIISRKTGKETMLDLGIGAGRTTYHFASLFKKYIGVDFSAGMIVASRNRFKDRLNAEFIVADVTSIPQLQVDHFDFILYSLNGIDCLRNFDDRVKLLSKIYNLLGNGGVFAFSAHNTKAITRLYTFQWPRRNPYRIITEYIKQKKLRSINGPLSNFINKDFFQLYDGGEYFKAFFSYISPALQIKLLKDAGFKKIQTIGIKGNELALEKVIDSDDDWIHYFCYKD